MLQPLCRLILRTAMFLIWQLPEQPLKVASVLCQVVPLTCFQATQHGNTHAMKLACAAAQQLLNFLTTWAVVAMLCMYEWC